MNSFCERRIIERRKESYRELKTIFFSPDQIQNGKSNMCCSFHLIDAQVLCLDDAPRCAPHSPTPLPFLSQKAGARSGNVDDESSTTLTGCSTTIEIRILFFFLGRLCIARSLILYQIAWVLRCRLQCKPSPLAEPRNRTSTHRTNKSPNLQSRWVTLDMPL
jgi:hypothetical protein